MVSWSWTSRHGMVSWSWTTRHGLIGLVPELANPSIPLAYLTHHAIEEHGDQPQVSIAMPFAEGSLHCGCSNSTCVAAIMGNYTERACLAANRSTWRC